MVQKILKIVLVITTLLFVQINFINAQTKISAKERAKQNKDAKLLLGKWTLNDVKIEEKPNLTDDEKRMGESMKKSIRQMIGKISMEFQKDGNFIGTDDTRSSIKKGTWRYEKQTNKMFVAMEGQKEEPQNALINDKGELVLFDERNPALKMILVKK